MVRHTFGEPPQGVRPLVMNRGILSRVILFFTTIALLVGLIAWAAIASWHRTVQLKNQLTARQWQSLEKANQLQETMLKLNNMMLGYAATYAAYRSEDDWTNFEATSDELGFWFNAQAARMSSEKERQLLNQITATYQDYLKAAQKIHRNIYGVRVPIIRVEEFSDLEKQSKTILNLGLDLWAARQQTIDQIQARNIQSLNGLRLELLGSLTLLLAAVIWLGFIVYRDMIAPLQVQLVESRQLMERQEKLASLGMLAAGVAHEIRNPLTAIKAWLYLQQKHLKPGTQEFADAELIGGEINRLERIVKDVPQFARPSEPQFVVVPAEQPLQEIKRLLGPQLEKAGIQLQLEPSAPAHIRVDPQQIKQVLINLVQNAADSIGTDGTITLRARDSQKRLNDQQTDVVILEVQDTGKGIPEEAEKRLFDPFFTTKESGTGLGLPIAARIVEKHRGALQYQTHAGSGTTFGIILPQHNKK
jgi:signal transduction histidine kinase